MDGECGNKNCLTHSPLKILPKNTFWSYSSGFLVTVVLLRAKTYHKAVYRSYFAAFWSRCKISACEVQACAESKISRFKSDTAVLTFTFLVLSSPPFSLFFCLLVFFSSCWAFSIGFILVGKVFRKAFRILGLDARKGRWKREAKMTYNPQKKLEKKK